MPQRRLSGSVNGIAQELNIDLEAHCLGSNPHTGIEPGVSHPWGSLIVIKG